MSHSRRQSRKVVHILTWRCKTAGEELRQLLSSSARLYTLVTETRVYSRLTGDGDEVITCAAQKPC